MTLKKQQILIYARNTVFKPYDCFIDEVFVLNLTIATIYSYKASRDSNGLCKIMVSICIGNGLLANSNM